MPRPRRCRRVCREPGFPYFKPAGIRMVDLEESILTIDEFEAVRLKDLEGLEQDAAAERMNISQPTFHRLIIAARKGIADAIVNGKAIRIEGGAYETARPGTFRCFRCDHTWKSPRGTGRSEGCPRCKSRGIRRDDRNGGPAGTCGSRGGNRRSRRS